MRLNHRVWMLGLAACLLPLSAVFPAQSAQDVPVVRAVVIRDFARVTFEWPKSVYLETKTEGNTVVLRFDRKANPRFGTLLTKLSPYITRAELGKDGKTVRLVLNKPYRVRSFISGNLNGVDILGVDPRLRGKTPALKEAQNKTKKPPAKTAAAPKKGSVEELASTIAKVAALSPSAGAQEAPPAKDPAQSPEQILPQEAPAPGAGGEAEDTAEKPAAPHEPGAVKVFASTAQGRTVLRFAWQERVAAAAFVRGGTAWIVFSKHKPLDMDAVKETANRLYPSIAVMDRADATVLRIEGGVARGILAAKTTDSFEWSMVLVASPQGALEPIALEVNTEPPLPAHVFLPVAETAPALTLQDPEIGDMLLVVPTYKAGEGVSPRRSFVEFALLETAQGVAVQKIADNARITPVRNGLRVGLEKGAQITPRLPKPTEKEVVLQGAATPADKPSGPVLFPYESWKVSADKELYPQARKLTEAIAEAQSLEEASKLRLKLARMYFAEGLSAETLGMLLEIKRSDPEFYVAQRASAIAGATNFMLRRFNDATQDFASAELQGTPEIAFWQRLLDDLQGKPDQEYNFLENDKAYSSQYPPLLRRKLAITATDKAVADEDYALGLQILDVLKTENQLAGIEDDVAYLSAKIALETGKEKEGLSALAALAENYGNVSARARAEFTLITHALQKKPEDTAPLLARLERLYASWRGDSLEMETLKLLGELYSQKDDYASAMKAWRDLISNFPSTVAAADALTRLRGAFVTLFDGGAANDLSPLNQLSLYYEFRNLTPANETGDRIVGNIADRLVAVDLLEQAITLLDYRMRYLYAQEARSRTGARLARVYLTNRQPAKALGALQSSVYGDNPKELRTERDRIAASAMVELAHYSDAMQLLAEDRSADAEKIRQRAWWKQKDWPKLITSVEADLKNRKDVTATATAAEAEQLVQLALAYVAEGDTDQLHYLRDYFTPLLKASPREKLFAFITAPDAPITPATLGTALAQAEDTRAFLKDYIIRPALPQPPAVRIEDTNTMPLRVFAADPPEKPEGEEEGAGGH